MLRSEVAAKLERRSDTLSCATSHMSSQRHREDCQSRHSCFRNSYSVTPNNSFLHLSYLRLFVWR